MFGALCSSEVTVGTSPAIFGLLAGLLALLIVNWKALNGAGPLKFVLIFVILIVFVFYLMFGME